MSDNNLKAVIESLLFASEKPLTVDKIKNAVEGIDAGQIKGLVEELKLEYESSNRGMRISEVAGGYQMITANNFAPFLKRLYKDRQADKLSKPALETLAIIAYKQPVTKLDIESLRSVNIDGVISSLLDRGLIRITGRKKAPGRPKVYGTSTLFLEYFGLKSLEELPKMDNFQAALNDKQEVEDVAKEPSQSN
jgi:segregation and condensation protein B